MKHGNLAFFVPHQGCPHQCSFCSQRTITGQCHIPSPQEVAQTVERALSGAPGNRTLEIAFFGGSFTAIPVEIQMALLGAALPYVQRGQVAGIRLSTRPDAVDEEILLRLKRFGVTAIELGAQSMREEVLQNNQRGHTAQQVRQASAAIRAMGFSLGLQMMVGLDGDTAAGAWQTARELAALHPDTMRIYPTVVLPGTPLAERFLRGEYVPMTLETAVSLCAGLLDYFEEKGIRVIRLGLHSSPELERERLAGPWHPAFRELCESRRFFTRISATLEQEAPSGAWEIAVHPSCLSKAVGQRRANVQALAERGYDVVFVPEDALAPMAFSVRRR